MLAACVLRNLTVTSTLDMTPLEKWNGVKPSIERLRVLGSKTYCQFDKTERVGKYGAKGEMDGVEREEERKGIRLLTDSQSAKALAENPVYHGRSKHILAKWHFVRERVESGQVKLEDVRTAYMAADMLTKSVGPAILAVDMKLIGMNVQSG